MIGFNREIEGKMAGLRTHAMVALGAALFALVPLEAGVTLDQLSRVAQGIIIGIGFLGEGTVLKFPDQQRVRGLTTAATVWITAAVGLAVGLGLIIPALLTVSLAWLVLFGIGRMEKRFELDQKGDKAAE